MPLVWSVKLKFGHIGKPSSLMENAPITPIDGAGPETKKRKIVTSRVCEMLCFNQI